MSIGSTTVDYCIPCSYALPTVVEPAQREYTQDAVSCENAVACHEGFCSVFPGQHASDAYTGELPRYTNYEPCLGVHDW